MLNDFFVSNAKWASLKVIAAVVVLGASSVAAGATLCVGKQAGCYSTIGAAVVAASKDDVVQVSRGTYPEQVTITKPISLVAEDEYNTIIDATGLSNGIFINGLAGSPGAGVVRVAVSGFTVQNANYEGILVVNGADITLLSNVVRYNNKMLDSANALCPGIPAFETSEGEDCGEGIHMMATSHSLVAHNVIEYNSGGILSTDETGPNYDNLITGNTVRENGYACGITMASHPRYPVTMPPGLPFGLSHNTISHNVSVRNGLAIPGAGAGVGIFAPGPGNASTGMVVIDNELIDNGLPGVTMHNHAAAGVGGVPAFAPPVNLNDNVIIGNHIAGNAADTADAATTGSAGINLHSVAPVKGTVIAQNLFEREAIDIAFSAPSGELNAHLNSFERGSAGVAIYGASVDSNTVDASENWWGCAHGPGTNGCASMMGSAVKFTPWLLCPIEGHSEWRH